MGVGEREMDECGETLKRATSGPVLGCGSTCLAASLLLSGTGLLLRPVDGREEGGGGEHRYTGVCVCYITKKVCYC